MRIKFKRIDHDTHRHDSHDRLRSLGMAVDQYITKLNLEDYIINSFHELSQGAAC